MMMDVAVCILLRIFSGILSIDNVVGKKQSSSDD